MDYKCRRSQSPTIDKKLLKLDAFRVVGRLCNGMGQDATFKEELDLIEAQSWGMNEGSSSGLRPQTLTKT